MRHRRERLFLVVKTAVNGFHPVAALGILVRVATTEWRKLVSGMSVVSASKRRHWEAIEQELFGGCRWLPSKNDDNVPASACF